MAAEAGWRFLSKGSFSLAGLTWQKMPDVLTRWLPKRTLPSIAASAACMESAVCELSDAQFAKQLDRFAVLSLQRVDLLVP